MLHGRDTGTESEREGGVDTQAPFASPAIALPKGGGALQSIGETFQVSPATGTSSLSVPIAMSPGRAGFAPSLTLSYDSGSGNGPYGLGWNLSQPSITRKTQKGLPRYQDENEIDTFVLSGAEDLVPALVEQADGTWVRDVVDDPAYTTHRGDRYLVYRYRPRIEGLFARIERWVRRSDGDAHWRAITGENRTTIFGETEAARIVHPDDGRKIFAWLIERSYDDKGNAIVYEYKEEDNSGVSQRLPQEKNRLRSGHAYTQKYLKRALYGNSSPYLRHLEDWTDEREQEWVRDNRWHFELVLDYGDHSERSPSPGAMQPWPVRLDPFSSYRAGFEIRTYRLCRRLLMFHNFEELGPTPYLVRSTQLSYNENPAATQLREVRHWNHEAGQDPAHMPPVRFEYAQAEVDDAVHSITTEEIHHFPDGRRHRWLDLEGEGLNGLLSQHSDAWYYQRNEGDGHFRPPELIASMPSTAVPGHPRQQLTDLNGNGRLNLVSLSRALSGSYELNGDDEWDSFVPFQHLPNLNWDDPNLRLIDVTGDGRPDVLVTEDECLCWHTGEAREGFGPARRVARVLDEEQGPAVVFADGTQSVYLADMSGDGLTDMVRIRNGEICYWPNTGYGTFGAKVTMDRAPTFDGADVFDQRRIRMGDIDGTGTADVIYLGPDAVCYWLNQAGNSWGAGHALDQFPRVDNVASVEVMDLLGHGTACIVWTSPLPGAGAAPLKYIPLMSAGKPYLLTEVDNSMGAITRMQYAPSTRFYLLDREAGRPWITKLPFPVHVVERKESYDAVSRNRFVSRYAYHHGYFDGDEREFRGFGMVEQWDTEYYSEIGDEGFFPVQAHHLDEVSHVPPVLTRTWFHNGFFMDRQHISRQYEDEYYHGDVEAWLLPDTELPYALTTEEQREACRALKNRVLRQEVFGLDRTAQEAHPYTVAETTYHIRREQPRVDQKHAVFYVCDCESLTYHYERNPADPRIAHTHTLEVDSYGNVLKGAAIAYPRRSAVLPEQARMYITYTESHFIHLDQTPWTYRVGLPSEQRSYEIRGLPVAGRWDKRELATAIAGATEVPFHAPPPDSGDPAQKRLVGRTSSLYYRNSLDPDDPLPPGQAESLGLPYAQYRLAFTQDILDQPELGGRITADLLHEGGYRDDIDGDATHWWIPSDTALFDQTHGPAMFYLPVGSRDPFGEQSYVEYDDYRLLPVRTTDPLGNAASARIDYRVLRPWELTDPNGNCSQVAFDIRGFVIATAIVGKDGEGDTLADPSTRFVYDLFAYERTREAEQPQPNWVHSFARERHGDPATRWQETYAYSDGFGRAILTKVQAEDGPAPTYDAEGNLVLAADDEPAMVHSTDRWVGNGATVFNNKGLPVRQYEPFFDSRPDYTCEAALVHLGVSPTLHYDPLGRTIRTDLPGGSFSRVEFDPWQQVSYDQNDTILEPDNEWYATKNGADASHAEREAAVRAAIHFDTPTRAYLDVLGRPFVSMAHNKRRHREPGGSFRYDDEFIPTRTELDVEGNPLAIYDGRRCEGLTLDEASRHRGNTVMTYLYAMGGLQLHQDSMDGGERWALVNVAGNPIRGWDRRDDHGDGRGQHVHTRYDSLQRPTHLYIDIPQADGSTRTILAERTVYGEVLDREDTPTDEARTHNHRGQLYLHFDGAGLVKNSAFDFKDNLLEGHRRLATNYRETPDWSALEGLAPDAMEASALLEAETFTTRTRYDALNRPVEVTLPDDSVHLPGYNKANLLERVQVRLRGAATLTGFVTNIDYNARGQRTAIEYANGVRTTYQYDDDTFRLIVLHTTRARGTNDLQNLHYTYDPVGNITEIRDDAIEPVFFRNEIVEARSRYTYDALYRLIEATGRESAAVTGMPTHADIPQETRVPAHDLALRNYVRHYDYDPVGNILQMRHVAGGGSWTRDYNYELNNNRLRSHGLPGGATATYAYDGSGNMIGMPHLERMEWDYKDQLRHTAHASGNEAFYTYDSSRQRVRKVWLHDGYRDERIYLGGLELYRRYSTEGTEVNDELQSLHVMDDAQRICIVETPTVEDRTPVTDPRPRFRYQLSNHLGSATVELDEGAGVLTYEEYHPYGTTAYHARNGTIEVSRKRYRYTGMERDEETGLNYHTARYYAPWLGRWCSADPIQLPSTHMDIHTSEGSRPLINKNNAPQKIVSPESVATDMAAPGQKFNDEMGAEGIAINAYDYAGENPISFIDTNGFEITLWRPASGHVNQQQQDAFAQHLQADAEALLGIRTVYDPATGVIQLGDQNQDGQIDDTDIQAALAIPDQIAANAVAPERCGDNEHCVERAREDARSLAMEFIESLLPEGHPQARQLVVALTPQDPQGAATSLGYSYIGRRDPQDRRAVTALDPADFSQASRYVPRPNDPAGQAFLQNPNVHRVMGPLFLLLHEREHNVRGVRDPAGAIGNNRPGMTERRPNALRRALGLPGRRSYNAAPVTANQARTAFDRGSTLHPRFW
jgi:RHS repeat-associated protein